jgi:hypothetical protein
VSREIHSEVIAEIDGHLLRPALLLDVEFASGTARLWTGIGDLAFGGNTYLGAGALLGISPITETTEVRSVGISATLSGMPPSIIQPVLAQARHGRPVVVRLALLELDGKTIVGDPIVAFEGRLDVPSIEESGGTCVVRITAESRLVDLERPRERRYTHEDQQIDHPGDLGFDFVAGLQDETVPWGLFK